MQVSGGNGDNSTQSVCLLAGASGKYFVHQVCFCMHGVADCSRVLHCLEVPTDASQRARAEVHHKLVMVDVMNASAFLQHRVHNNQVYVFSVKPP